ncbi:MAG: phosphotransferase [Terrimesophilobacter sp.]
MADSLPWERLREIANPYLREPASGFEEIGDGNLNYIYRVWSATDSVIVKHALDYIRISHGARPLTIDRTMYEARALAVSDTLAPGRVPRVHTVIADSGILVMEDLRHHRTLRSLCLSPDVGHERLDLVGEFLARTHLQTSAVLLAPEERAAYVTEFINPDMVRHTLGVTFRRPFNGSQVDDPQSVVVGLAQAFARDLPAGIRAQDLALDFASNAEALLHGDMHTGSVMVDGDDVRVIDPEFAMMGPIGFDLGCFLAHLAIAHVHHVLLNNHRAVGVIEQWASDFWAGYVRGVAEFWPEGQVGRESFLARQLGRTCAYAGIEMIRRVVGGAYVPETTLLDDDVRIQAHTMLAARGRVLLLNTRELSWGELWRTATTNHDLPKTDAIHHGTIGEPHD